MTEEELLSMVKDEFAYLKEIRQPFEDNWKNTENYVCEKLYNWTGSDETKPERPDRFTSVPANNLATLVAGLLGYTVSPNIAWLKVSLDKMEWLKYKGVKDWLEQLEKVFYATFAKSNLYSEVSIAFRDAATFGHTPVFVDEDIANERVRYMAMQTPEIYTDVNEFGEIDTVYRAFTMTVRQCVSFFGEDKLCEQLKSDAKDDSKKNKKIDILHAVYPRQNRNSDRRDMINAPFASVYVDMTNNKLIEESGYYENPYCTFVWTRIPNTGYGDSPAQQAMPDIIYLNYAEEARLKLGQISTDPAYNVPDDMRGFESVLPGGLNYYTKSDMLIKPIDVGANFPMALEVISSIEKRVRDWFHVDFFLMLQQQQKQKTATEVVELQGEKAAVLSTLIVNQNSFLEALIHRTFNILYRQGKIPPFPEILAGSGASLKIDFIGPLAQAQKRYHQAGGISTSLQMIAPVLQMNPAFLDYIDTDKLGVNILDSNSFPQDAIREDDEVAGIRQTRAKMQQEQERKALEMQQLQLVAQNANKLNEPVKQGSPLADLDQQRAGGISR